MKSPALEIEPALLHKRNIPRPYYLYVGQMEPFPTSRSHDLDTFLACIRPHVRIYVSHFVVNTYISVCMSREVC